MRAPTGRGEPDRRADVEHLPRRHHPGGVAPRLAEHFMAGERDAGAEAPEIVRVFPTFLWRCQLRPDVYEPINAAILRELTEERRSPPPLARGTAWQSGPGLHRVEAFADLVSRIRRAVESVGIPADRLRRVPDHWLLGQCQFPGRPARHAHPP